MIGNQPIIFNIIYTPWKSKSNAAVEERKKFGRERPYYEMRDGGKNIYEYMTSDRKLNGENFKSEMRDMISYFEKSTRVQRRRLHFPTGRQQIDGVVKKLLLCDKRARKADNAFYARVSKYGERIKLPFLGEPQAEHIDHYKIDPQNMTVIDELIADYKRRQATSYCVRSKISSSRSTNGSIGTK